MSIGHNQAAASQIGMLAIFSLAIIIVVTIPMVFLVAAAKLSIKISTGWMVIPFASLFLLLLHPASILIWFDYIRELLGRHS